MERSSGRVSRGLALLPRLRGTLMAALLLLGVTGCTGPQDPFVDQIKSAVAETSFAPTGQMPNGCIGVFLICTEPLYEPSFSAPASTEPAKICQDLFSLGVRLGAVAYSTYGNGAYKLPAEPQEINTFCIAALANKLRAADGSTFYQGIVLYDDGKKDGWGKVYALNRGGSDNDFQLVISVSKDLNRVGWITYASS